MIPRLLLPLACLLLATCSEPFAAQTGTDGPPTGAIRVNVTVPGIVTFDEDGFDVTSPYATLPFGPFGGTIFTPDLPEGLAVRLQFQRLAEWCHPSPPSKLVTVVADDTLSVDFTVNCDVIIRPVYYIAHAHPDTLAPFNVGVRIGLQSAFTLTTGVWHLDSLPVNQWQVTATPPPGCHRDPNDDPIVRVPVYSADTVRYHINVICGP